ncbi:MAG: DUF3141 domain-containing protein [Alphaproteobacteria bacterium]|nr:DUF3141 domain-containing protein [Alphaproteobacteria bacterium]
MEKKQDDGTPQDFMMKYLPPFSFFFCAQDVVDYVLDAAQRSILFFDVLRQRGNNYFQRRSLEAPNVLLFGYEVIADGRTLPRPVNYMLMRIVPPEGMEAHPNKRPFIVFDPRAGHGPGIGGMKRDSEIGAALHAGHPCYFVGFLSKPVPGQLIEDICYAEAAFIEIVINRHPEADGKPCLIGNCQAGWQVMMTAALNPDLAGPIILAGTPLSYWGGVHGKAPMRYMGGILCGSWTVSLLSDLGNGLFDGAILVRHFENLNPGNTYWSKDYNLYSKVDTERERFLDFEKWWGNPVLLNGREIQYIVDELFVGNKLSAGEILTKDRVRIDLRRVQSPIVVFCSHGDEITPPQQALGWILDLYNSEDEIIASGQTIIYSLHASIGHLGIFVSGSVARKQYQEFSQNIDFIDILPPGLYEASFQLKDENVANADLLTTDYVMTFHPRKLDDLRALGGNDADDDLSFAAVARFSENIQGFYRLLFQPMVRAFANPWFADMLRQMNPVRQRFELFSDKNPCFAPLSAMVKVVEKNRRPVSTDNFLWKIQEDWSEQIVKSWDTLRDLRDHWIETVFLRTYGSPFVQAAVGLRSDHAVAKRRIGYDVERQKRVSEELDKLRTQFSEGGDLHAFVRSILYIAPLADERSFVMLRVLHDKNPSVPILTLDEFKALIRQQYMLVRLDPEYALQTLPDLLKDTSFSNADILESLRQIIFASGILTPAATERFARIEKILLGETVV